MKNSRDVSILPPELLTEIFSWLPVKTLMRFACVSKSWKSLIIDDSSFVKLHLNRSPKNTHILLNIANDPYDFENDDTWVVPSSVCCLIEDLSSMIDAKGCYLLKDGHLVIGSSNGLICFGNFYDVGPIEEFWVQLWNPATHLKSKKSPTFNLSMRTSVDAPPGKVNLGFGYDNLHDTYKVVLVHWNCTKQKMETMVYCVNDIFCRKILSDPCSPILLNQIKGQFVGGCLNWLALKNMNDIKYQWDNVTLDQLVIASFDMSKEVYRYLPLPKGVTEVPRFEPSLKVLGNHMYLFHDHNSIHLFVWKMVKYGALESWTQLLSISYERLHCIGFPYIPVPMFLLEDGDILMIAITENLEFIKYNIRDYSMEYIPNPNEVFWMDAYGYVPSLVSPCQD
ncbi:F-box/kelch-repeat protein At3g23880-like isoform X1 [Lotus japonicus]|uniref:F-box/kelch-repeat protein At3g23880-like isoform X1 n=2 Tax=Lotus japonicus TaxID=34305 RepID=UPI0025829B86|nr:F-box/kelch-repeat protein At3g23880-like isoform X1 [Lotus japonicus]